MQSKSLLAPIFVVMLSTSLAAGPSCAQGDPAKGKQVFEKQTCAVCHPGGGNTIDKNRTLKSPAFKKKTDAEIAKIIRCGVKGSSMPAFSKDKISDAQMKDLLAYIRTLK
jgi:mono/diheme cytochrome c family protein